MVKVKNLIFSLFLLLSFFLLLIATLLLALSLFTLYFNWFYVLFFLIVSAIAYLIVYFIGCSLDKSFNKTVKGFIEDKEKDLSPENGLSKVFGFLILTLLPFLIYSMLFSLYFSITFSVWSLSWILRLPRIPIILLVGFGAIIIGSIIAIFIGFKSLFFPVHKKSLGITLSKDNNRKLWNLTNEIASKLNTKPVDKIVIKPSAGIGVYLESSLFKSIFGKGKRVLEIGLGSIHDIKIRQFKAILAHEYGHFGNKDTQWSSFIYAMSNALLNMIGSIPGPSTLEHTKSGSNSVLALIIAINPAYWILDIFVRIYFRVTNGFTRIREVNADINSMKLYGGKDLREGLIQVVTNDTLFNQVIQAHLPT